MCTKLPNWGAKYNLSIGDSGFLTLQEFQAGENYYDRNTGQTKTISFSNVYFKEFIKDKQTSGKIIL